MDIAFGPSRVAIDVRGCYWHGHAHEIEAYRRRANSDYWVPKIAGNQSRDADTERRLESAGWLVIVVWECEDVEEAAERIDKAVRARRQ